MKNGEYIMIKNNIDQTFIIQQKQGRYLRTIYSNENLLRGTYYKDFDKIHISKNNSKYQTIFDQDEIKKILVGLI
jgi:NAD+--asparagine ADP-ribosyltransferase